MSRSTPEIETELRELFVSHFNDIAARIGEEIPILGSRDRELQIGPGIYSPIPDIAVGPFALGNLSYEEKYDELAAHSEPLLTELIRITNDNFDTNGLSDLRILDGSEAFRTSLAVNPNARCFLAAEIESSGSRKHFLGDLVNASSLGRVGLVVGADDEALAIFMRIMRYLKFLTDVGKPRFIYPNLLVMSSIQLIQVFRSLQTSRSP